MYLFTATFFEIAKNFRAHIDLFFFLRFLAALFLVDTGRLVFFLKISCSQDIAFDPMKPFRFLLCFLFFAVLQSLLIFFSISVIFSLNPSSAAAS